MLRAKALEGSNPSLGTKIMSKNKKKIRETFRNVCLIRDQHQCLFCGEKSNLDVHHITNRKEMPNGGYVRENGITLCKIHHEWAEEFYSSGGKIWGPGMHPNELYERIKSSFELAYKKSEELSKE